MSPRVLFTIFTPTYNRAHLLSRVYRSLHEQTLREFEWIVVDDGSEDNTAAVIREWVSEADFRITYQYQQNSGKHVAINRGVAMARGEYFVILDDDDWLHPTALERMLRQWEAMSADEKPHFAGVVGLYAYKDGAVVGTRFPCDVIDSNPVEIRTRYRVGGDKFGVHRTEVLRNYPFPEDIGKFVPESLVWNRIALHFKQRYVNEIFAYTEYQPEGLSARSVALRSRYPMAARICYREFAELEGLYVPTLQRIGAYANYTRFSAHGRISLMCQFAEVRYKLLYLAALPVGYAAFWRDRIRLQREENRND